MKEDTAHTNAMQTVEKKICTSVEVTRLHASLNIHFRSLYRQLQFINSFKYVQMELNHFIVVWPVLFSLIFAYV